MRPNHYTFASPASQILCERGFNLATRIVKLTPLYRVTRPYQEQSQQVRADLELQLLETNIALLQEHRALATTDSELTRFDETLANLQAQLEEAGGEAAAMEDAA